MRLSLNSTRGLEYLEGVLSDNGIHYWIDSGVLLGLIRHEGLIPWEKDIDLAIEGRELPRLLELGSNFREIGYEFSINRYRGVVYSVGLKPDGTRPVDALRAAVHVYYEVGEYLWSPQVQLYIPPPAPDVLQEERSLCGRVLRRTLTRWLYREPEGESKAGGAESRVSRAPDRPSLVYRLSRWLYRRIDRGIMAETWPIREVFVPLTWVIPKHLVLPIRARHIGDREYPVPCDVDAYLSYRYGDWRTPVRNWCYWVDDGAIKRERPFVVRDRLLKQGG